MGIAPRSGLSGWLRSRSGLVFLGFLAIAVFFLWSEHRAHLLGILPFALLLLCPLLHLFHGAIGTRGLTGLRYVLLGSVAEHVLRETGCDVLAVRPDAFRFELP